MVQEQCRGRLSRRVPHVQHVPLVRIHILVVRVYGTYMSSRHMNMRTCTPTRQMRAAKIVFFFRLLGSYYSVHEGVLMCRAAREIVDPTWASGHAAQAAVVSRSPLR